jgi:Ca-activated chloride channel family protein
MRLTTRCLLVVIAFCATLLPLDAAAQERAAADKTLSPYFFVEGGDPDVDRLPLKDTRVDVAITGVIADVTVRQVYENRGQRPLHARYIFPASTRAAVYGMTMTVGMCGSCEDQGARERPRRSSRARRRKERAPALEESRPTPDERANAAG